MSLSRNTVTDQVLSMGNDVSQQSITDLQKAARYSMFSDDSTHIDNHARLLVMFHCAVGDIIRKKLMKASCLHGRTQGVDIYNAVLESL